MDTLYLVAVNFPLENSNLFYFGKDEFQDLPVGTLIYVPLGRRKEKGIILKKYGHSDDVKLNTDLKIKNILGIVTESITLSETHLKIFEWTAKYYHYSLGKLIFDCMPSMPKKEKFPSPIMGEGKVLEFSLNSKQNEIVQEIGRAVQKGPGRFLVHGITGSGKTIIYLEIIKSVLKEGKSVLFLLPEINLTPQFLKVFATYLNSPIYPYHSEIKKSEKFGLWKLLINDFKPKVIVGTRSSIFLPVSNLGLIIVDEEHDLSFKQDDRCPYNARDLALIKSKICQVSVVLGSATPSVEMFYASQKVKGIESSGNYYYSLKERVGKAQLPDIEIVDEKIKEAELDTSSWPIHPQSLKLMREAVERKEQILVFLNRLGFANFIQCPVCGQKFSCVNCSTNLRFFKKRKKLLCQFCDYEKDFPESCSKCGCLNLFQKGYGTEKVMEVLQGLFPHLKVDRFDRDEIKNMHQLNEKLEQFHRQEIDILVGTQMLSKGHNFKKVSLVLILGIDSQINYPDFRSNEKVFQLLTQVSGRSGRFGGKSKVIIQTLGPENEIFSILKNHDYWDFYEKELEMRKDCCYPPYSKLAVLYIFSRNLHLGLEESRRIKEKLATLATRHFPNVAVSGPKSTIIEKRVNQFSWCIMLKSEQVNELHNLIRSLKGNLSLPSAIKIKIDIDPFIFQ